jgi:4-amino-4-deoxy-L-arabinose transferase
MHQLVATDTARATVAPRSVASRATLLTLLLTLLLAFSFQNTRGLWGPDEGRYSNIALEMVESGDWLTPRRHPEHTHFAKPPLTYWAIATSVRLLGKSEFALRLPNALSLLATVGLLVLLGRRLVPTAPWLPGLIFATSLVPFAAANLINTDYLLTAFETLAVYGFVRVWQAADPKQARRGRLWLWIGLGLAFMTKGPPGLLPLLPIVVFVRSLPAPRPALVDVRAVLLFVVIALPWYVAVIAANPGLLDYFLHYEVVGRVFTGVHDRNAGWLGAFNTYLPVLLLGMLPWSLILAAPLRQLWRGRRAPGRWWRARAIEDRWLLIWFALPLLVFAFARSRLPLYILPLLVPAALVIARRWQARRPLALRRIAWTAAVCAAFLLALKLGVPLVPHAKDTREMAAAIRVHWPNPGEIVFIEETALYGLRFYLDVPVERVTLTQKNDPAYDSLLLDELHEHEKRVFITTESRLERIAQTLGPAGLRFVEEERIERYVLGRIEAEG